MASLNTTSGEDEFVLDESNYSDDEEDEEVQTRQINAQNLEDADNLEDDLFQCEEATEDNFMSVKPWKGSTKFAPSNEPANDSSAPDNKLSIEWVYGYRCFESRSNLVYNTKGQAVYPVGALVVTYDASAHTQKYFQGHNDDVICLAQNPANPDIVATGQTATIVNRRSKNPHACVHNTVTGESWTLKNAGKRCIRSVGFSKSGKYLATVGGDDRFTVTIWDWQNETKVCSKNGSRGEKLYHLKWSNKEEDTFVVVGKNVITEFTFDGSALKSRSCGGFSRSKPKQTFYSATFTKSGSLLVGARDGKIYAVAGNKVRKCIKEHKTSVLTIDACDTGFVSGDKSGNVYVFDGKLTLLHKFKYEHAVRSVYISGNDLLVGTAGGQVFHVADYESGDKNTQLVTSAHFDGETWGIAIHPDGDRFATCGEDNRVIEYDLQSHKKLKETVINTEDYTKRKKSKKRSKVSTLSAYPPSHCARAIEYSPDGKNIVIGLNSGRVQVYDAKSFDLLHSVNVNIGKKKFDVTKEDNWIQSLKFSPSGNVLAVSTHGRVIALLDVTNDYKVSGSLKAHNAAVTHLDFSADGNHIRSVCRGYELLFHDVDEKSLEDSDQNKYASKFADTKWATHTSIFGWDREGIRDTRQDGTDVNICDVHPSKPLLATGDDYGYVNLFRWPVHESGNEKDSYTGHSSHVVNVRFTPDGKSLLSAGGMDKAVIQWKIN